MNIEIKNEPGDLVYCKIVPSTGAHQLTFQMGVVKSIAIGLSEDNETKTYSVNVQGVGLVGMNEGQITKDRKKALAWFEGYVKETAIKIKPSSIEKDTANKPKVVKTLPKKEALITDPPTFPGDF